MTLVKQQSFQSAMDPPVVSSTPPDGTDSINQDHSKTSNMEGLNSGQSETASTEVHSSSAALREILARLDELEKHTQKLEKRLEVYSPPAPPGPENDLKVINKKSQASDESDDSDNRVDAIKHDDIASDSTLRGPATATEFSEEDADDRYKYTEVISDGSRKIEKPVNRPKLDIAPTTRSKTTVEYEIRFFKSKENENSDKREFILKSAGLKQTLLSIVKGWVLHCGSDKDWSNDEPLPLRPLIVFHHWDQLDALAKSREGISKDELRRRESLQHLLDDIEVIDSDTYMEFKGLRDVQMTLYTSMHYLFTPGRYMVAKSFRDLPQVFQVDSYHYDKDSLIITAWSYDWNGSALLRRPYKFNIPKYDDEKRINELPIYPVEFFAGEADASGNTKTGWPALREVMRPRAQLYQKFCKCKKGSQLFRYSGFALQLEPASESQTSLREQVLLGGSFFTTDRRIMSSRKVDEEIVIDPSSFLTYGPDYAYLGDKRSLKDAIAVECKACGTDHRRKWMQSFPYVEWSPTADQNAEDFDDENDHFMLLPSRVLGFLLGQKKWAQFNVAEIYDIAQEDTKFDVKSELALPADLKFDILQGMVKHHNDVTNAPNKASLKDPISGKGEGLIFLFHGPTGVGKTLTAEMLARQADMPLYKAGISEIGTRPNEAEKGLKHLFDLAQAWNAILLIDEADVFLDSRGSVGEADLEKNAMVALLLREVEYFSGILIMTTNRVMTFDVAMLSRIHWPINFGYLTRDQEDDIWKIWIEKWVNDNKDLVKRGEHEVTYKQVDDEKRNYETWRDNVRTDNKDPSGLNGREIRNIFMSAKTMANGKLVRWDLVKMSYANITRFRKEMYDKKLGSESKLLAH